MNLTMRAPGTCVLAATQEGNASYFPTTVTRSFQITSLVKRTSVLTILPVPDISLGAGSVFTPVTVTGGINSSPLVYTSSTLPYARSPMARRCGLLSAGILHLHGESGRRRNFFPSDPVTASFRVVDTPTIAQTISFFSVP